MDVLELMTTIARAPLRTMRYRDLRDLGTNTWRQLDDLVDRGALLRIAQGVYTAPPDGRDGRTWRPGLESAGLAVATARHGERNAVLMGIGAARHWGAIPRAIGASVVAVPTSGHRPVAIDSGTIHFVQRDLDRIEASLEPTELGTALVTTPEQTLFDLLMRPHQGGLPDVARAAARQILPQGDPEEFAEIIGAAARINAEVRRAAVELEGSR